MKRIQTFLISTARQRISSEFCLDSVMRLRSIRLPRLRTEGRSPTILERVSNGSWAATGARGRVSGARLCDWAAIFLKLPTYGIRHIRIAPSETLAGHSRGSRLPTITSPAVTALSRRPLPGESRTNRPPRIKQQWMTGPISYGLK